MTIASASYRKEYDGNDSTTVFPYDFLIFDEDHLTVTLVAADDTETTLTIATDYTVSGVGVEAGGQRNLPCCRVSLSHGRKARDKKGSAPDTAYRFG